ncbi:hypothetical protein QFC22_000099 [Naganishia vaughanmartiniae]|uniref:Uncharacterized protein n=1 Tax=Naganishia vaughanmartiniae TaxID=1424756 RepID=A0ACC2XP52_9TREE|nr:hypothetical protein QFC22_000099 [Naganishia vaughanmartiniae]
MTSIDPLQLDAQDPLAWARQEFEIPLQGDSGGHGMSLSSLPPSHPSQTQLDQANKSGHGLHVLRSWLLTGDGQVVYLCGNSLGLLPKKARELMIQEIDVWSKRAVYGHFAHPHDRPWKNIDDTVVPGLAKVVATLSPQQIDNAVVALEPREGEDTLRTEDILARIEEYGDEGAYFGLDLAHAVGNVPLELSAWGVDFAAWCTYKYLNSGPGAVAGYYIKEGLDDGGRRSRLPYLFSRATIRLAGWWGQNRTTRFLMSPEFDPIPGAQGYQHSNPPVFSSIPLIAHLELLERAGGMQVLRRKSEALTGYLWDLLERSRFHVPPAGGEATTTGRIGFRILTPSTPSERGCQLSLLILPAGSHTMERVFNHMVQRGVVGDERRPDVIRLSPVPLYNRFVDVQVAVRVFEESLQAVLDEGDV